MGSFLIANTREQAGSDSYNRFDFQTSFIFHKLIELYKTEDPDIIFCEYHEDLLISSPDFLKVRFFQVKTKDKGSFTFNMLFNKEKTHSFMGYLLYNFLTFSECQSCFFVINNYLNEDIINWHNSTVQQNELYTEDLDLYDNIKEKLKTEFSSHPKLTSTGFEALFNKFIKNTHFIKTPFQLEGHSEYVHSQFINVFGNNKVYISTLNMLHTRIREEIKTKSTHKFKVSPSREEVLKYKALESNLLKNIKNDLAKSYDQQNIEEILKLCSIVNPLHKLLLRKGIETLIKHPLLQPEDTYFISEVDKLNLICLNEIQRFQEELLQSNDFEEFIPDMESDHPLIDKHVMRGAYYVQLYQYFAS